MSKVSDQSAELKIVADFVANDNSYRKRYPLVTKLNVFSVSRLAWNWEDVVKWKLHPRSRQEWNGKMLVGKILGTAMQNEFVRQDERWFTEEPEIKYHIPYRWKIAEMRDIILFGHPDLVHHDKRIVAELKTSVMNSKIYPYAKLQVAFYWAALKAKTGKDYTAKVIKVSVPPAEETLSKKEKINGAQEIIQRAYKAAKKIEDEWP